MSRFSTRTVATCPFLAEDTGVVGRGSVWPPAVQPASSRPTARDAAMTGRRLTAGTPSGEALPAVVGLDELVGAAQAAQPRVVEDGPDGLAHVAAVERLERGDRVLRGLVALGLVDQLQRPRADVPDGHHGVGVRLGQGRRVVV